MTKKKDKEKVTKSVKKVERRSADRMTDAHVSEIRNIAAQLRFLYVLMLIDSTMAIFLVVVNAFSLTAFALAAMTFITTIIIASTADALSEKTNFKR